MTFSRIVIFWSGIRTFESLSDIIHKKKIMPETKTSVFNATFSEVQNATNSAISSRFVFLLRSLDRNDHKSYHTLYLRTKLLFSRSACSFFAPMSVPSSPMMIRRAVTTCQRKAKTKTGRHALIRKPQITLTHCQRQKILVELQVVCTHVGSAVRKGIKR